MRVLDPVAVQQVRRSAERHTLLTSLDVDGTISSHQVDPRRATIDRQADGVVRRLVALSPTVLLSGRSTTFLARHASNRGLWLFGLDGRAWITPEGLRYVEPSLHDHLPRVRAARREVARQLVHNNLFRYGIYLEPKDDLGFAVHHGRPVRAVIASEIARNQHWAQLSDAQAFLAEAALAVPTIMNDIAYQHGLQVSISDRSCEVVAGAWSKRDGLLRAIEQLQSTGIAIEAVMHFGDSPDGDGPAFAALKTIEDRDHIPTLAAAVATEIQQRSWQSNVGVFVDQLDEVPLVLSGIGELERYSKRRPSPLSLSA